MKAILCFCVDNVCKDDITIYMILSHINANNHYLHNNDYVLDELEARRGDRKLSENEDIVMVWASPIFYSFDQLTI